MAGSIADVSFAGSIVTISGSSGSCTIKNFADDANPIEFHENVVSDVSMNLYGYLARSVSPLPIIFSVTVVPGSDEDGDLTAIWKNMRLRNGTGSASWESPMTAKITLGNTQMSPSSFQFTKGTMISGPGGPGSKPTGKMSGRTFTFAFAEAT